MVKAIDGPTFNDVKGFINDNDLEGLKAVLATVEDLDVNRFRAPQFLYVLVISLFSIVDLSLSFSLSSCSLSLL